MRKYPVTLRILPGLLLAAWGFAQGPTPVSVPTVKPRIIKTLPHDPSDFTQGLFLSEGLLYESTGQYGRSSLKKIDAADGKVLKRIPLPDSLFGEGIALFRNRIWQLTWKEGIAQTYAVDDLQRDKVFRYQGEGWGLTTIGSKFYMSNGSDTLFVRDSLFKIVQKKPVRLRGKPLSRLNELEFARGRIYANVWYSDEIAVIDPQSGRVTALVDARDLGRAIPRRRPEDVLNGIAYDPQSGFFYLTGKNWPFIFIVEITGI